MTRQKHLKRRIRERMRKTGESYSTARLHILGRLPDPAPEASETPPYRRDHPHVVRLRTRRLRRSVGRPLSLRYVAPAFAILLCLMVGLTALVIAPAEASTAVISSVRAGGRLP